ncbi:hypothetical protein CBF23_005135 [Marinomonas agarivorans]|nr:hypothetical protein CBF23_005135 [Marinomonas agarivorans]
MTRTDIVFLSTLMALWGFNFSVIKLGVNNIDPLVLTALRFTFAVFPLIFFIKKPDVQWRFLIAYGVSFGVGVWGLTTLSIDLGLSVGMASLLLDLSVVSSLLLGYFYLKEQITIWKISGSILALVGLFIIIGTDDGSITWQGLVLVLSASAFWSVNGLIVKKANTNAIFAFNIWSMLFAPLPLLALAWVSHGGDAVYHSFTEFNQYALLSILFQAYPTTLLGYWLWNKLIMKYSLSTVAPFTLMVPVFGILGGYLFYNEAIVFAQVIAAILILLGLLLSQRSPS